MSFYRGRLQPRQRDRPTRSLLIEVDLMSRSREEAQISFVRFSVIFVMMFCPPSEWFLPLIKTV